MSSIDAAILQAVESFVEELKRLIQQAAMESVQVALTGGSALTRPSLKGGRSTLATAANGDPKKRAKRTPDELEALSKRLRAYIAKNPGQRIEQIGRSLDLPTK